MSGARRTPSPSHPGRAALWGLCAGCLLGGLGLLGVGAQGLWLPPDCRGLLEAECLFQRDTAHALGRLQVLAGSALGLLGLATFLLLRSRRA